jgi:hypothetical protein
VVGVFATNHQPQVLPPYFAARKNNPVVHSSALKFPTLHSTQTWTSTHTEEASNEENQVHRQTSKCSSVEPGTASNASSYTKRGT